MLEMGIESRSGTFEIAGEPFPPRLPHTESMRTNHFLFLLHPSTINYTSYMKRKKKENIPLVAIIYLANAKSLIRCLL